LRAFRDVFPAVARRARPAGARRRAATFPRLALNAATRGLPPAPRAPVTPATTRKLDGSYHAHSRVTRQRRYIVPSGNRDAAWVLPHDLHLYCQEAIGRPPYNRVVPLICNLNSHPRNFAARRHIAIRGRKISKYSITCDNRVSIVNSSVIVWAASSTRRKEYSTA